MQFLNSSMPVLLLHCVLFMKCRSQHIRHLNYLLGSEELAAPQRILNQQINLDRSFRQRIARMDMLMFYLQNIFLGQIVFMVIGHCRI